MNVRLNSAPAPVAERELSVTRIIDASPEQVFAAWTQCLPRWWGPYGMVVPFYEMDLRPGGAFRTVMRAPDGMEYQTRSVFLEIIKPSRIVFTDAFAPDWRPRYDIFCTQIARFDALCAGRTACTAQALHWTSAACEKHAQMGFHQVWIESLERLADAVLHFSPLSPDRK